MWWIFILTSEIFEHFQVKKHIPKIMAPPPLGMVEPIMQMNKYCSYVTMLADPNVKDENKLKAAQELSENYEVSFL